MHPMRKFNMKKRILSLTQTDIYNTLYICKRLLSYFVKTYNRVSPWNEHAKSKCTKNRASDNSEYTKRCLKMLKCVIYIVRRHANKNFLNISKKR